MIMSGLFGVEESPVILNHVFATVHPHCIRIIFLIFVGIAIDFGDVDVTFVVAFDKDIPYSGFLQGALDVRDEVAKIGGVVFFP